MSPLSRPGSDPLAFVSSLRGKGGSRAPTRPRLWPALALWALTACPSEPAKPPTPPAAPAAPVEAPTPPAPKADGAGGTGEAKAKLPPAPTDGLSLAERVEKRKAAESKLAAQLASDETQRLLAYDKGKLPLHNQVFAYITKTRAAFDKAKDRAAVEKISAKEQKAIVATGKKLQLIDPKGGNSNVVTDYDVMLNALASDYPAALFASFEGDKQPLVEQRSEMDKRTKKIEEWLHKLKGGK